MDGRLKLGGDTALKTITGAPLQLWGARGAIGFLEECVLRAPLRLRG